MSRETPSSVEISRNAKQEIQYAVKVYAQAGDEAAAMEEATRLFDALTEKYASKQP